MNRCEKSKIPSAATVAHPSSSPLFATRPSLPSSSPLHHTNPWFASPRSDLLSNPSSRVHELGFVVIEGSRPPE
ncbi:hypothetical protein CRG98_019485 [Punica granatum]|uniref:Uncharacterized protein n=1 Tax=Punica granatum TaxID=22663 RepID=A0A2I0JV31_PUNGR|nr:hypothetical protein CRG98_019485 [Punica granatum]